MSRCENCMTNPVHPDKKCCFNCARRNTDCGVWHNCGKDCPGWEEQRMTNADRIRAMTDEELADFLILSPEMEFDVCKYCKNANPTPRDDKGLCLHDGGFCYANDRAEAFKKWLKQPAEVE